MDTEEIQQQDSNIFKNHGVWGQAVLGWEEVWIKQYIQGLGSFLYRLYF